MASSGGIFALSGIIGIASLGGAVVLGSLVTTWILDEEKETRDLFEGGSRSPPPPPASRRLAAIEDNFGYRGVAASMRGKPSTAYPL